MCACPGGRSAFGRRVCRSPVGYWDALVRVTRQQLLVEPHLAHYVTGWPRPTDFGTIAADGPNARGSGDGEVLGAAWCRLFDATDPGCGYLADDVPEVTIGVAPAHRSRGAAVPCSRR